MPSPIKINTSGALEELSNTDSANVGSLTVANEYQTTDPPTPTVGMEFFTRKLAAFNRPAWMDTTGYISHIGPAQFSAGISIFWPYGNGTSFNQNLFSNTTSGTAGTRTISTTNYYTQLRKIVATSAGTSGATAGFRHTQTQFFRGDAANKGGFFLHIGFAHSDSSYVANSRTFAGFVPTGAALANVNPSSLTNLIGMGYDSGQTTFRIMHNDSAGSCTTIDLGANFPTETVATDVYFLALFAPPNSSNVYYHVLRANTGDEATGTLSTDLPSQTTLLAPQLWRNNGTTASAVAIDVCRHIYVEHLNQ